MLDGSIGGGDLCTSKATKACIVLINSLIHASMELIWVSIFDNPIGLPRSGTYYYPCGYKPCAPRIETSIWGLYHLINWTSSTNLALRCLVLLRPISPSHWLGPTPLPIPSLMVTPPQPWASLGLSTQTSPSIDIGPHTKILCCGNIVSLP